MWLRVCVTKARAALTAGALRPAARVDVACRNEAMPRATVTVRSGQKECAAMADCAFAGK